MKQIAFIVNDFYEGPIGIRGRSFAQELTKQFSTACAYRTAHKVSSIGQFIAFLFRTKPQICYVVDIKYSGIVAAAIYAFWSRCWVIVDTGDAISELAVSLGRGRLGCWLTGLLERTALRLADGIIVRGTFHKELLIQRGSFTEMIDVIQDGVDTSKFQPMDSQAIRQHLGLGSTITVGLVGSSKWSEKLQMCYGSELVEVIRQLKDRPVMGVMIGDGSGIQHLKQRCREYGIEDRVIFTGRLPYEELPRYLNAIDICLSTQTNDLPGQVRTTGKLPLYLATGRHILASRVGEASLALSDDMLVEFTGSVDPAYPQKLAERVRGLLDDPKLHEPHEANVALARAKFEYSVLGERLACWILERLNCEDGSHRWASVESRTVRAQ